MTLKKLFIGILFIGLVNCQKEDTVSLQIKSKDETGKAIGNASIFLNGSEIGISDSDGIFNTELSMKKGEHRLEIVKEGEKAKYLPYQQDILHYRDGDKSISIDAVLASIPKESETKEESSDDFPQIQKKEPLPEAQEANPISEASLTPDKDQEIQEEPKPSPKSLSPIIDKAEKLLSTGNPKQAILTLRQIQAKDPGYLQACQKIGEIYLSVLDNPEKALSTYNQLTNLNKIKNYDNPKYLNIYVNKAIAYFQLGELHSSKNKQESIRLFKNTAWITQKATLLLKNPDDIEQVSELVYYYNALSLHRIWQIKPNEKLGIKARIAWAKYQKIAKNIKTNRHEKFFANSQALKKQIKF